MSADCSDFTSPFGTYALSALRDNTRRGGGIWPANKVGKLCASAMRRLSLLGHNTGMSGPLDVQVAKHVRARLYPASNRCEKRAFCGVQTWDGDERAFLAGDMSQSEAPFIFVDVGANVGLYSLFMNAAALAKKRAIEILAIEPDPENRARLTFNAQSSDADITVEAVAVSGESGSGFIGGGDGSRGTLSLHDSAVIGGVEVRLEPLTAILNRNAITRIDAMKVDIEGHDLVALTAFFRDAPDTLYPSRLLVEIERGSTSLPLVDLAVTHGYRLHGRTKMNAMLERAS